MGECERGSSTAGIAEAGCSLGTPVRVASGYVTRMLTAFRAHVRHIDPLKLIASTSLSPINQCAE